MISLRSRWLMYLSQAKGICRRALWLQPAGFFLRVEDFWRSQVAGRSAVSSRQGADGRTQKRVQVRFCKQCTGGEGHFSYVSTHIISPSVLIERDVVPYLYKGVPWAAVGERPAANCKKNAASSQHQLSTMFDSRTTSDKVLQHHH
eukprot:scaffold8414_cov129-Skeletonema_menzelii.AAC.2